MHKVFSFCAGLWLCGLLGGVVRAETLQLNDGQSASGDIVSFNENGLVLRLSDGKYSDRIPWGKFSQEDLRKFAENPKMATFVEPFIEVTQEEIIKKTEVPTKPPPRLERPPPRSLFGALFASGVGVLMLLLIYGANIFAAYEVALFRAQPLALVCGVAAVLPLLGPIIFLAMPTRMTRRYATEEADAGPEPEPTTYAVPTAQPAEGTAESAGGLRLAQSQPQAGADATAPAQVFARGQYTFNRRFFETKFPGFFSMIRREAERDLVLVFKTSRGEFTVQRITRIASSDLHAEVSRGGGAEEMMISFPEIQEVQLKHKNT